METLGLALRVGLSLACVLGLVWLVSKGLLKGGRRGAGAAGSVEVLARQSLSRAASLAVVRVGDRGLVVGVTEQQVTLLGETDLDVLQGERLGSTPREVVRREVVLPADLPADLVPEPRLAVEEGDRRTGPLAGSALSPATWSQAVEAIRERTTRR